MKTKIFIGVNVFIIFFAGCYTQLMTPVEYIKTRKQSSSQPMVFASSSTQLNYSTNCLSCHSKNELDDRYYDMKVSGLLSAHGYALEPSLWTEGGDIYIGYEPDTYWPSPIINSFPAPWWLPPATSGVGVAATPVSTSDKDHIRKSGSTRDTPSSRDRNDSNPQIYTAPPTIAPVGGTTSTPTTPSIPTATLVPTPPSPPAQQTTSDDGSRRRSGSTNDSTRRKSGSSRDGDPPR